MANAKSDVDLLLYSGLKGLKFVGLIEDIRGALEKDVFYVVILEIHTDWLGTIG